LAISYNDTDGAVIGAITPGTAWRNVSLFSNNLIFATNGSTERMRITSGGLVGIGTNAPSTTLHLSSAQPIITLTDTDTGANSRISADSSSGGLTIAADVGNTVASSAIFFSVDNTERMRITDAGSLVVATTTPSSSSTADGFVVSGTNGSLVSRRASGASQTHVNFVNNGVSVGWIQTSTTATTYNTSSTSGITGVDANTVAIRTNSAERMRLDTSGNLLVGKTTTSINVSGFRAGATGIASTNANDEAASFNREGSDGNVVNLRRGGTIVGNISVTASATAYNTSSDYRLKDIDGPIANSGAYIDALKPVQGSWKADGSRFIGLLAHEVQEVSETPIATGEKDGEQMQAMDYSAPEIIANLIAELQSLRARVAQLEGN
jgi:hypothetical protein